MHGASPDQAAYFFFGLFLLLGVARGLGEAVRRVGIPPILGEITAGLILGQTVFGAFAPELQAAIFPVEGPLAAMREGVTLFAVCLFLMVTGLEIDLRLLLGQGRVASAVGLAGLAGPLLLGAPLAWLFPAALGYASGDRVLFAAFFGVALAVSSLPVIARTLRDLNVFRSDVGMVIIGAAVVDDLAGWALLGLILSAAAPVSTGAVSALLPVLMTSVFTVVMLTAVRRGLHVALAWLLSRRAHATGVLAFAVGTTLLAAGTSELLGGHAVFGAFLAGVALGDSRRLRQHVRRTLDEFVSSLLAPLFFASIALPIDFRAFFDPWLSLAVLLVASAGKLVGCAGAARLAGLRSRESWAIGWGMNARGAMGLLFAALALQARLIEPPLFVALVAMSLATSAASGPAMAYLLRRPRRWTLRDLFRPEHFIPDLDTDERREAIHRLVARVSESSKVAATRLEELVWERECMMPTGIGHGVAVPHAIVPGLGQPVVAFGVSPRGIDFEGPDGHPAHLICLILTPEDELRDAQLQLLADLASRLNATLPERLAEIGFEDLRELLAVGPRTTRLVERASGAAST